MDKIFDINDIFNLNNSTLIMYKNDGDDTGKNIDYLIEEDKIILPIDMQDNVCLEFSVDFTNIFKKYGSNLKLELSSNSIKDLNNNDTGMMFRSQIIKDYDTRLKEAEVVLSPDDDICEDILSFNLKDLDKIDKLTIDIWGYLFGLDLNRNKKCQLSIKVREALLDYSISREGEIIKK